MVRKKRIRGRIIGKATAAEKDHIRAYEASPFSNKTVIQDHEKEKYEECLWVQKTAGVLNKEDAEVWCTNQIRVMRLFNYQRSIGANAVIEVQAERTSVHTQKMRDARAESLASKRAANRELAEQAIEWARKTFVTAAADNSIDFLKTKAAERLKITKRTLNNWLKK